MATLFYTRSDTDLGALTSTVHLEAMRTGEIICATSVFWNLEFLCALPESGFLAECLSIIYVLQRTPLTIFL